MVGAATHDGFTELAPGTVLVPDLIPVFPLAGTVLLPGEVLPLHIFEPRYRDMVRDALAGHRVIGMVEPQEGFEREWAAAPPLRPLGCVGFIAEHRQLDDGRFLLWLVGLERFRLEAEVAAPTRYRQARVTYQPAEDRPEELAGLAPLRRELKRELPRLISPDLATRSGLTGQLEGMSDTQLIAFASQVLEMDADRKRQLLGAATLPDRLLMVSEDLFAHLAASPDGDDIYRGPVN